MRNGVHFDIFIAPGKPRTASIAVIVIVTVHNSRKMAAAIKKVTTHDWKIMEICGGQTHSIIKFGLDELLPKKITLIHGPGCPVCVTPLEAIDKIIKIASLEDTIVC